MSKEAQKGTKRVKKEQKDAKWSKNGKRLPGGPDKTSKPVLTKCLPDKRLVTVQV